MNEMSLITALSLMPFHYIRKITLDDVSATIDYHLRDETRTFTFVDIMNYTPTVSITIDSTATQDDSLADIIRILADTLGKSAVNFSATTLHPHVFNEYDESDAVFIRNLVSMMKFRSIETIEYDVNNMIFSNPRISMMGPVKGVVMEFNTDSK